jgi:hypothetical protein
MGNKNILTMEQNMTVEGNKASTKDHIKSRRRTKTIGYIGGTKMYRHWNKIMAPKENKAVTKEQIKSKCEQIVDYWEQNYRGPWNKYDYRGKHGSREGTNRI